MGFCIKCGTPVQDGEQFCANCNNVGASGTILPGNGQDLTPKKKGNKKLIPIIAGAAALVVIVILAIAIVVGVNMSGPDQYVKKSFGWIKSGSDFDRKDAEKILLNYTGNEYIAEVNLKARQVRYSSDYSDDYDYDDYLDGYEETIEANLDKLDDRYGDDWKITYEIKKKKALDEDELEELNDRWEEYVDGLEGTANMLTDQAEWTDDNDDEEMFEKMSEVYEKYADKYSKYEVTKGYHYKVSYKIEGEDDKDHGAVEFDIVEINGKWVSLDGYNPVTIFFMPIAF